MQVKNRYQTNRDTRTQLHVSTAHAQWEGLQRLQLPSLVPRPFNVPRKKKGKAGTQSHMCNTLGERVVTDKHMIHHTANIEDDAQLDVAADSFWG